MKKRFVLASALALALPLAGLVARAETPAKPAAKEAPAVDPHAKHDGKGHQGGMMMGEGMGDGCPMMAAHDGTMKVTNQPNGVTITWTAQTPEAVAKLQKMAETMQTKHAAHAK